MRGPDTDFEYERRFFVANFPKELIGDSKPNLIVQTYFLASQGYGLRIRLQATAHDGLLDQTLDGKAAIEAHLDDFDLCVLAAKGPYIGGTRYEAERELDVNVGAQMCLRGGTTLVKLRYGVWFGEDGWVIDQFGGDNHPLIIAECATTDSQMTNSPTTRSGTGALPSCRTRRRANQDSTEALGQTEPHRTDLRGVRQSLNEV